jgi:hypothetical protein
LILQSCQRLWTYILFLFHSYIVCNKFDTHPSLLNVCKNQIVAFLVGKIYNASYNPSLFNEVMDCNNAVRGSQC